MLHQLILLSSGDQIGLTIISKPQLEKKVNFAKVELWLQGQTALNW